MNEYKLVHSVSVMLDGGVVWKSPPHTPFLDSGSLRQPLAVTKTDNAAFTPTSHQLCRAESSPLCSILWYFYAHNPTQHYQSCVLF